MAHSVAIQHICAHFMAHSVAMQHISAQFYGTPVTTQHTSAHHSARSSYRRHIATEVLISPTGRPDFLLSEDDFKEVRGSLNWCFLVKIRCIQYVKGVDKWKRRLTVSQPSPMMQTWQRIPVHSKYSQFTALNLPSSRTRTIIPRFSKP